LSEAMEVDVVAQCIAQPTSLNVQATCPVPHCLPPWREKGKRVRVFAYYYK
jgi:hypothetical protein